jgi:hypothetical protein
MSEDGEAKILSNLVRIDEEQIHDPRSSGHGRSPPAGPLGQPWSKPRQLPRGHIRANQ